MKSKHILILGLMVICSLCSFSAWPHGYVGQRFFPATIAIDDPVPGDELDFTTFRTESPAEDNNGNSWTTNPLLTWNKRITPYFQLGVVASYLHIHHPNEKPQNGFDNWSITALYEAYREDFHESVISLGLDTAIGGTGSHIVEASHTTMLSPSLLFGQGLGSLNDTYKYLRPFAITGSFSPVIEASHFNVTDIEYGLVIEYSLPYFQAFVHTTPWIDFMNHLIPLVELPFNTCVKGDCSHLTTGTINPGVLYISKQGQIGLEAIIPVNRNTGNKIGGVLELHLYLDDVFPNSFLGKPIFNSMKGK